MYGQEYFFGGMGIEYCPPVSEGAGTHTPDYMAGIPEYLIPINFMYYPQGGTIMGPPHKIEELGETQIPQEVFTDYLFDLSSNFT